MARASRGSAYFRSYNDLSVHELMLKDRARTLAYRRFFEENRDYIQGKTVMDVGAGTGILSLFAAAAGAKKVYAVEASDVASLCEEIVQENHLESVIEVIHGAVEEVELAGTVDVIVSEWMGFYLLHESMLNSVIVARDKFLAEDGILVPSEASLMMGPVDMSEHFQDRADEWSNIYGFDFSPVASRMNEAEVSEPMIKSLEATSVKAEAKEVMRLDLKTVTEKDVRKFSKFVSFTIEEDTKIHGFATWFDVVFTTGNKQVGQPHTVGLPPTVGAALQEKVIVHTGETSRNGCGVDRLIDNTTDAHFASSSCTRLDEKGDANGNGSTGLKTPDPKSSNVRSAPNEAHQNTRMVTLSTGPGHTPTHWKQTVIFLPQTIMVPGGLDLGCLVRMEQDTENMRHYNITLELKDEEMGGGDEEESDMSEEEDEEEHPTPCDCGSARCCLIAALMEKYDEEHQQLEKEAEVREVEAEVEAAKEIDAEIESGGWQVEGNVSTDEREVSTASLEDRHQFTDLK